VAFVVGFAAAFVLYLPYAGVGARVLGFLPTYLAEEGIVSGERFPLLRALRLAAPELSTSFYLALVAAALGAATVRVLRRSAPARGAVAAVAGDGMLLGGLAVVLSAPHYAWYYVWLVALSTLAPSAETLWLGTSGALLYHAPHGATARLVFELLAPGLLLALLCTRLPPLSGFRARARVWVLGLESARLT
jgi:hypothetical protein